jgi:trehalose synthase
MPFEVEISPMDPNRFRPVLPPEVLAEFDRRMGEARQVLAGRCVWNVNSTAQGGGVVELLRPLLAYARGAGVDARWMVIDGTPEFFRITKRIHNRLHGAEGDGGPLGEHERQVYEQVLADNAAGLAEHAREGDVFIVHDPQPAGLVPLLLRAGSVVIWRCHVGLDTPNQRTREAWDFLRPHIVDADAYVFSREAFVWEGLDRDRIAVIAPTIDIFSPKNIDIDAEMVRCVLQASGIVEGPGDPVCTFERHDGTPGRIEHRARIVEDERLRPDVPVVVQISRWDALKDPIGVIRGFAEHVPADTGAHLIYGGPQVDEVADDPEGQEILQQAIAERAGLPEEARRRIHLASLPMDDPEENAIVVNALQRHARVVAQKSLAEGFGLTVSEAMWKARPVVASRIGGIQDQVVDGETGMLLDDPTDLAAFGAALTDLLTDPLRAEQMGQRARERVRDRYLSSRSLLDFFALIQRALARKEGGVAAPV